MATWTKDEFNQKLREGRVTITNPVLPPRGPLQDSDAELPVQAKPLAKNEGAQAVSRPVHVRITSRRKRLADPDGLCGKYAVDSLRYAKVIREDTANDITYELIQEKADCYETVIEVFETKP